MTVNGLVMVGGDMDLEADVSIPNGGTFQLRSYTVTGINGTPTLTVQSGGTLTSPNINGSGTPTLDNVNVVNFGSITKSGGFAGTTVFNGDVTNESGGSIEVNVGGYNFAGTLLNKPGGSIGSSSNVNAILLSGTATNNGTIAGSALQSVTGTLDGDGTYSGTVNIGSGGQVSPNACLAFGQLGFDTGGQLAVDISGPNACTDYAQQTVSGTVVLGGSSDLNLTFGSYIPNTNDEFTIIDAAVVNGAFASDNLPADWNVQYDYPNTGEVTLVYTGPGPAPTPDLQFVVGEVTSGPSNTVTVPISVNNFNGITSFQGTISYDETVLTFQSSNSPNGIVTTTVGGPNGGSIPAGKVTFGWADISGTGQTLADGTVVAELTFVVAANAPEGQSDIEIDGTLTALGYAVDVNATSFLTPTLDQGFVYVDATPPAVATSNIVSNNTTNTAFAKVGDVVTLTFDTDEPLGQAPAVAFTTGNGTQTVTATGSGTSWTATFTVVAGDDGLVAWEITMEDIYGNSTTTTSTTTATDLSSVTIDTVDPVITCPFTGLVEFDNALGQCAGIVSWAAATATDLNLVGAPTQSAGPANGSSLNVDDVQTVTFTVSDAAGNTSTCSFDVVVRDTENPVLTVPAAATSYNNDAGVCEASVDLDALTSAVDNCTANPAITYAIGGTAITSPYTFPVGTTTVTATATDGAGLTDVETFDITVVDAEAPVLTVPAAATSYNNDAGVCEASVDLDALTSATDNCTASPAITYAIGGTAITSPYAFPVGTTTVTATATDGVGLTDVETFDITVVDAEAPVLTVPAAASSFNNDPGVCSASVNLDLLASATDNCATVGITYEVGGSAITSPYTFPVGTTTVTATATDGAGLTDVETFDVTVVDNENPVVITQPLTVQLGTDGTVTITGEDVDNDLTPSSDNCGIATYSVSPNTFDCNTIGANTVTLTVTDIHGNSASATAVVTVENNPVVDISGEARTMNSDLIGGVTFDLAGAQGPATQTGSGYTFTLAPCSSHDIGAALSDATTAGLDVNDAFAIIQHTLLINDLGSPYKRIAADVNNTDGINVIDAFQVVRRVLNLIQDFADPNTGNPATVAFVPSDYVFPDANNPWSFPTRRFYTDPAPATGQDFTGIKLGDANGSWLSGLRLTAPVDSFAFVMEAGVAQPGQLITIPVRVRDFAEVASYQFTLNWDASVLSLVEVRDGALTGMYNDQVPGKLAGAWFDLAGVANTLPDDEVAFELVFRAVGAWGAQTELAFSSDITPRKAYNGDNQPLSLLGETVTIAVGAATSIDPTLAGYALTQAMPNPFDQATTLVFSLGRPETVEVEIFNTLGQSVRSFRSAYGAGQHTLQWDGRSSAGAEVSQGVYFVRLRAGAFVSSLSVRKLN